MGAVAVIVGIVAIDQVRRWNDEGVKNSNDSTREVTPAQQIETNWDDSQDGEVRELDQRTRQLEQEQDQW